ncbi:MAG: DUF116 domain-containing protein, partial [Candidatus Diapherotrites archaeon]|nr:DUF116 domain-containing protein [Candidatus Diapherotrites archaeon]
AEGIGKSLGLSNSMIQYTHVELRNTVYEPDFKKIPFSERALFLPHCPRNAAVCKAILDEEGYHCKHCGSCNLDAAIKLAKKNGYTKIYIVPGGSLVKKILEKDRPKAAIGVSCFHEAVMAFELTKQVKIIPQAVLLLRDGCKDTLINLPLLEEKLLLIDENVLTKEGKLKKI